MTNNDIVYSHIHYKTEELDNANLTRLEQELDRLTRELFGEEFHSPYLDRLHIHDKMTLQEVKRMYLMSLLCPCCK